MRLSKTFIAYLTKLYDTLLQNAIWPEEWNTLLIAPILKPSKPPKQRDSYRPIHLCSVIAKLFSQIIESKLQDLAPASPEQMGFTKNYGTRDNTLVLNTIIDKYRHKGLYCAFVDFKAAFDTISRPRLIKKLNEELNMAVPSWIVPKNDQKSATVVRESLILPFTCPNIKLPLILSEKLSNPKVAFLGATIASHDCNRGGVGGTSRVRTPGPDVCRRTLFSSYRTILTGPEHSFMTLNDVLRVLGPLCCTYKPPQVNTHTILGS